MTQWQFLIQKEGDEDWLPLESSSAEILEGRYQLMAQGDRPIAEIDVQIRHEYEIGGILQEMTQRQRQQTDLEGRLTLLPLTYLPPGLWELNCEGTTPNQAAPQRLLLQVLAQEFDLYDWEPLEPASRTVVSASRTSRQTIDSAADAMAQSSHPPGAPVVSLPVIPKDAAPVPFQLSDGLRLPPMLYTSTLWDETVSSPELPAFLSLNRRRRASLAQTELSFVDHIEFLRRVAQSTDRQAVYQAFASLAWRQRFLQTLNRLAGVAPPMTGADTLNTVKLSEPSTAARQTGGAR